MKFRLLKNLPELQEGTILIPFGEHFGATHCRQEGRDTVYRFPWETQSIWLQPIEEDNE